MTRYILLAVLVILFGYGLIEAWPLIAGPDISITSPTDGAVFPGGIVSVSGVALRESALNLDGAPLLPDQQGNFSATLTFPQGGSILTFVATDRFGRTITKTREIFVPVAPIQATTTNP